MPQPIVLQYGSGLARGIEQAGSAFAQGIQQRKQEEKYRKTATLLDEELERLGPNTTGVDIAKAYSRIAKTDGIDQTYLGQAFSTLVPLYQSTIKDSRQDQRMKKLFPESEMFAGDQNQQQDSMVSPISAEQPEGLMSDQQAIPLSPQQQGLSPSFATNQLQAQEQASSPQTGIPQMQPNAGIPPMQATGKQVAPKPSDKYSIYHPGLGNISRGKIDFLLTSDDQGEARLGQALDTQWNNEYKQNSAESREINKEHRDEIRKYAEPYQDTSIFDSNLSRLKEAEKLIDSGKVSVDGQWFRTALAGIMEGKETPLAELVKTKEQQKLWYLLRDALKPKEIGGSNPSTKEVLIAMASLPGMYKKEEANKFIIKQMIKQAEIDQYKAKEISRFREENETISSPQFKKLVNESVSNFSKKKEEEFQKDMKIVEAEGYIQGKYLPKGEVWMMNKEGDIGTVPQKDLKRAISAGGTQLGAKK